MARISSALSGIERRLLDSLASANAQVTLSSYRMATGHKINSAADDPSAFFTLTGLQSQLNVVTATLSNVTAAGSMISQSHTALDGVKTQMGLIRSELLKDTDPDNPLDPEQRAAAQAKIDAALDQINVLAGTSIDGKMLLAGSADYFYSGRNSSQIADVIVRGSAPPGRTISGILDTKAAQATLTYTGDDQNRVDLPGGQTTATFTLTGLRGGLTVTVSDLEPLADVATFVNNNSYKTGITAAVNETTNELTFTSVDYGSSAFVDIAAVAGTFDVTGGDENGHAAGVNASAVINGITIGNTSNNVSGNRFTINQNGMSFEIEFQPTIADGTTFDPITVEGKNLSFDLSQNPNLPSVLTIPAVFTANFSGPSGQLDELYSGGPLSGLDTKTSQAIRVVDEALGRLTRIQGSVDGFYNSAVTSSSVLLSDMQTNLGKYIDSIDKTNDTEETLRQNYYQALADNAISGLAIINQQRMGIVKMLQDIAGLT